MADKHGNNIPSQRQDSGQSAMQGPPKGKTAKPAPDKVNTGAGMGSSQGQDKGSAAEHQGARPSAGTADIERGSPQDTGQGRGGPTDSLVDDPTGAFKERP